MFESSNKIVNQIKEDLKYFENKLYEISYIPKQTFYSKEEIKLHKFKLLI